MHENLFKITITRNRVCGKYKNLEKMFFVTQNFFFGIDHLKKISKTTIFTVIHF